MNKIYNNQEEIASVIAKKIKEIVPNVKKTVLNILPYIIIGMIESESVVASDISKKLKGKFSLIQYNSVIKRIRRFFKNQLFDPYAFYDQIISYVIKNYTKKHKDGRVHIAFDHMFSKDNFTVFMITMRIGKQGIPLWFRCFKGNKNSDAFKEELLKEGISFVSSLFNKDYKLIFLADRWFNSTTLLEHINNLGHTYAIRLKSNIKVLIYDKKEKHNIWTFLEKLKVYKYHSYFLENIPLTNKQYKVNIAISKGKSVKEPWIIVTNGDYKHAIKDYSYRYGAIETVFKNQKSNGFYLEKTVNASEKYFTCEYMMACLGILILTIIGTDYSKNKSVYKKVKIVTHIQKNGTKTRIMSLFNIGLTLFNRGYESSVYIRIPFRFILYDV